MLPDANRPIEGPIDVEDPVTAGHLAAVFDRFEEGLRDEFPKDPPEWMK